MKKVLLFIVLFMGLVSYSQRLEDYEYDDKESGDSTFKNVNNDGVVFMKRIGFGVTFQKVTLTVKAPYEEEMYRTGFDIFFENGKRITHKDDKVKVVPETSNKIAGIYSVIFEPTAHEIKMLQKYKIAEIRVCGYGRTIQKPDQLMKEAGIILSTSDVD